MSIAKSLETFFEPIAFEVDRARQRQAFCRRIVRSKSALKSGVIYLRLGNVNTLRAGEFQLFLFIQVKTRQVKMSVPPLRPRMPRYLMVNGVRYLLNNTPLVQSKLIKIL
jgi:hypothetical protein